VDLLDFEFDGCNINVGCGLMYMGLLIEYVCVNDFDVGFVFDGDGDWVFVVDCIGVLVDGDELIVFVVLYLCE